MWEKEKRFISFVFFIKNCCKSRQFVKTTIDKTVEKITSIDSDIFSLEIVNKNFSHRFSIQHPIYLIDFFLNSFSISMYVHGGKFRFT